MLQSMLTSPDHHIYRFDAFSRMASARPAARCSCLGPVAALVGADGGSDPEDGAHLRERGEYARGHHGDRAEHGPSARRWQPAGRVHGRGLPGLRPVRVRGGGRGRRRGRAAALPRPRDAALRLAGLPRRVPRGVAGHGGGGPPAHHPRNAVHLAARLPRSQLHGRGRRRVFDRERAEHHGPEAQAAAPAPAPAPVVAASPTRRPTRNSTRRPTAASVPTVRPPTRAPSAYTRPPSVPSSYTAPPNLPTTSSGGWTVPSTLGLLDAISAEEKARLAARP